MRRPGSKAQVWRTWYSTGKVGMSSVVQDVKFFALRNTSEQMSRTTWEVCTALIEERRIALHVGKTPKYR